MLLLYSFNSPEIRFTFSNDALTHLLSEGDHDLSNDLNRSILELTLRFIHEPCRFD